MTGMNQHCAACGAAMATDQRYCVECGQRRGAAQLPFLDQAAQRASAPPPAPQPRRPKMSVNTTLIAIVGTLMLAMGTGVLIGRSASGASGKTGGVQVLTVPSAAAAPSVGTTSAGELESSTGAGGGSGETTGAAGGGSKSKAKKSAPAKKSTSGALPKPEKAVVTIGSKGKGPGYQKGHFTGNFFGGEEAEEEGGEGSEEGEGGKGK